MMQKLKAIYQHQMFFPDWRGIFINCFYFARSGLRDSMVEFAPKLSGKLLDVGCGTKPYRALFVVDAYIGLDIDSENTRNRGVADLLYQGWAFPIANALFDSVLCNQVLEHVFIPDIFLSEIVRVLKPGGRLLLTVPFVWDEHEQPYDYARYSSFGLRALLEKSGLTVVQHKKLGADASILFQLANTYLYKITQSRSNIFRILITISVMAFVNFIGLLARYLLPKNHDLFLDHVILAEKPS